MLDFFLTKISKTLEVKGQLNMMSKFNLQLAFSLNQYDRY